MKKAITILVIAFCLSTNAQVITTVAGNGTFGYGGDGGAATVAELYNPYGIAIDAAGNLYIADIGNNCIRKVNTSGIISTVAGNGTAGYSGDGGQAINAELSDPQAVAVDTSGNLYISDTGNSRIRKVSTTGIITTIAGNGTAGYSGDGGAANVAELHSPIGLTCDVAGNLYIGDVSNNRVRKVTISGIITTIAGNGTAGFSGDNGQAILAELYQPIGVAFDAVGNLYIADNVNERIRMVTTSGIISTIAGNGTQSYSGDGGLATAAEFHNPYGIAVDTAGNLYIADKGNNRIRKVNTAGIISTFVGDGTQGYSGDGGQATNAELYFPAGVALDATGNLYISDNQNNVIRKITNAGQTTSIEQVTSINKQVTVYPNPSNSSFIIETNSPTNQALKIYDVNGKMVLSQDINGKATTIEATNLNEGVYNISIISNEGVINKRVIITH